MELSLEILAKGGCRISKVSKQAALSFNEISIVVNDLGSNKFYIGPTWGVQFDYFFPAKRDKQKIIGIDKESFTFRIDQEGGRFEYKLFFTYAALNIAMRNEVARRVESVALEDYVNSQVGMKN